MENNGEPIITDSICSDCGNIMQNGRCTRCDAIGFARAKRWRRGDRGGKRPERRFIKRQFQDAIDGIWKNNRHMITVNIDTEKGTYRSVHGNRRDRTHDFQIQDESDGTLTFYKDDLTITATINDLGFLIMHAADKKMAFAYEFEESLFRTCPVCYGKSIIEYENCYHCDWEFEPYLASTDK